MFSPCKTALIAAVCALLAACAATPESSPQDDAAAKNFASAPAAAIVYLYRADTPSRSTTVLWLDGRLIGESLPARYFRVSVRPGRNLLTAFGSDPGRLAFETRAGEIYFVAINVLGDDSSGAANSHFRSVPPEVGRVQIERCCNLLETWRPGQSRFPL